MSPQLGVLAWFDRQIAADADAPADGLRDALRKDAERARDQVKELAEAARAHLKSTSPSWEQQQRLQNAIRAVAPK